MPPKRSNKSTSDFGDEASLQLQGIDDKLNAILNKLDNIESRLNKIENKQAEFEESLNFAHQNNKDIQV